METTLNKPNTKAFAQAEFRKANLIRQDFRTEYMRYYNSIEKAFGIPDYVTAQHRAFIMSRERDEVFRMLGRIWVTNSTCIDATQRRTLSNFLESDDEPDTITARDLMLCAYVRETPMLILPNDSKNEWLKNAIVHYPTLRNQMQVGGIESVEENWLLWQLILRTWYEKTKIEEVVYSNDNVPPPDLKMM